MGTHFCLGPIWGPIFVRGPFGSHLRTHLEVEGRHYGVWVWEPPGKGTPAFGALPLEWAALLGQRVDDGVDGQIK